MAHHAPGPSLKDLIETAAAVWGMALGVRTAYRRKVAHDVRLATATALADQEHEIEQRVKIALASAETERHAGWNAALMELPAMREMLDDQESSENRIGRIEDCLGVIQGQIVEMRTDIKWLRESRTREHR